MPTAGEVARLSVVVQADTSPATKELDAFGAKVGGIGSTMATAFGGAAIAGIAAVGAGFAAAVTSAAGFEQTMSAVKAVSGATAEEMSSLSGLALQLGKDTSFSASEAGKGIEELVKGGLSIPDIMNGAAKATLDLAAAGGVSLPDAATIAANALAEFNLKGEDMAHVADLIAGAANASALDVSDFKTSLQASGAVAATIGFTFDDLAVAIAEMGKAGITGSDAGTSLKTMMLNLSPQTLKAKDEMQALGIITADGANQFFDAAGKVKSMAEVAQVLQNATANLTQEQKLNALATLFGSDAIRASAVLAKEGAAGFGQMGEAMGKVTAEAVGATKLDNMKGSVQQLTGSVETLAIEFGTALLPVFRDTVDGATNIVNALIPIAREWGPKVAEAIKALVAELRTDFGGIVSWFVENWPLIEKTFQTVSGSMQDENHTLLGDFRTTWGEMFETVKTNTANIGDALKLAMHIINGDWQLAWQDLTAINDREQQKQLALGQAHGAAMQRVIDNWTGGALTTFDTWMKDLASFLSRGWEGLRMATSDGLGAIGREIGSAIAGIKTAWQATMSAIEGAASAPADALRTLTGLVDKLKQIMPDWLIPHSPTPFQIGLEGIMKAVKRMDGAFGGMGGGLEMIQQIGAMAASIGGDDFGRAAAAIAASETGGGAHLVQQGGGGAVGPFQFDPGGELRNFARDLGVSMAEAARVAVAEPGKAAAWALHGYLGAALHAGISQGLSGAALANFGSRYGQRPAGDNWKMAGEWFQRLFPGYAAGGWAGLNGPELALLGERGPEYVVPNHALGGGAGGAVQVMRVDVAIGGKVAANIYVEGRDFAIRQGRVPSWAV